MRILHINTSDKTGGAAIAALRLHNAMISAGIDSRYFVLNRTINDRTDIITVSKFKRYVNRIFNVLFEKLKIYNMRSHAGLYSSFKYGIDIASHSEIFDADIIYIHWINSFVNYKILKQLLKTKKPFFWFMHDMFAITGGCHHSFDCLNYQTKCCNCQYRSKNSLLPDLSKKQYEIKKKIYKQFENLIFITPSKWLFDCAQKSSLAKNKQVYYIPNLVDTAIFKSINKNVARRLFSLDIDSKIIGFGANYALTNPYKGWEYLKEALQMLANEKTLQNKRIEVLIFGSSYSKKIADNIPFPVHFLGHLYDEYSLVMAYNSMDVLVVPSLADNLPNTILESLHCNTPVVGFNIGGIPDMVNNNTGYLAEYKNSNDLAKGISVILQQEKQDFSRHLAAFMPETLIKQHLSIIEKQK